MSDLPKALLASIENCIALSSMTSLGYQSNSGPSGRFAPSLCRTMMLLLRAFASACTFEYLFSPETWFHATSAVQLVKSPSSHPLMLARTLTSKRSSLLTVNDWLPPMLTSKDS